MKGTLVCIALSGLLVCACSSSDDSGATDGTSGGTTATDATTGTDGTDGTDATDGTDGTDGTTGIDPDCELEPTLASLEADYFAKSCALAGACHKGPNPTGILVLDIGTAHGNLVNVDAALAPGKKLVVPGDPDNSFLVQKLEGTMAEGEGKLMPEGAPAPISPGCRIATLRAWIAAGAPQ